MDDRPQRPPDDQQRRVDALRGLAHAQPSAPTSASRPPVVGRHDPRPPGKRRGIPGGIKVGATLVAAVLVLAGVLVLQLRRPTQASVTPAVTPQPPAPALLNVPLGDRINCVTATAWAPDGGHIALLNGLCGGWSDVSLGVLDVYDAFTGTSVAQIELGSPLAATHGSNGAARAAAAALIWSPDDQEIALTYTAEQFTNTSSYVPSSTTPALVLVRWASKTVHAYYGRTTSVSSGGTMPPTSWLDEQDVTSQTPIPAVRWDVQAGAATPQGLSPALGYTWQSGSLVADPALPAPPSASPASVPSGAPGNPDGASHFTIWQSGAAGYISTNCVDTTNPDGTGKRTCCPVTGYYLATYGASAAWSPDGRYLVATSGLPLGATVRVPFAQAGLKPLPGGCSDPTIEHVTTALTVHDAGEAAAMKLVPPLQAGDTQAWRPSNFDTFAWSPDGRMLAVVPGDGSDSPINQPVIHLFDCATGQAEAVINPADYTQFIPPDLQPSSNGIDTLNPTPPPPVNFTTVQWSPNGQRLLALDPQDQVLVILGPAKVHA